MKCDRTHAKKKTSMRYREIKHAEIGKTWCFNCETRIYRDILNIECLIYFRYTTFILLFKNSSNILKYLKIRICFDNF